MTRINRQVLLAVTVVITGTFLTAFLANPAVSRDPFRPEDVDGLARWVIDHPADWLGASALTDHALDSSAGRRRELWHGAYGQARYLAPYRTNPHAAFVRGGLFHWYELAADDRKRVLEVTAPLLRDPLVFRRLHQPLWQLTGDLDYLRRTAPREEKALVWLRDIASTNGFFAQYRELRDAVDEERVRRFEAQHAVLPPPELIALLPPRLKRSDEPLVRRVLEELERRPLVASNAHVRRVDDLVSFVIRHRIKPLTGLEAIVDSPSVNDATRARLALALSHELKASTIELAAARISPEWNQYFLERADFEERRGKDDLAGHYRRRASLATKDDPANWKGLCGRDEVCNFATTVRNGPFSVTVQNAQSDQVAPYVELYVDDALVAEGAVEDSRVFTVAGSAKRQRVELRLVNPWTRNRIQRRVRLS